MIVDKFEERIYFFWYEVVYLFLYILKFDYKIFCYLFNYDF